MTCGVYKIENKVNGKVYIGCSNNIERRWREHKLYGTSCYGTYHCVLYDSINKYGIENFSFNILEECNQEELFEKERYYIDYYDSYNNGYNMTFGGEGNKNFVKINEDILHNIRIYLMETDIPMSNIAKKYNINVATVSAINTGKHWYNEQYEYPLRKSERNPHYFQTEEYKNSKKYCKICNKELRLDNITGYCSKCINSDKELRSQFFSNKKREKELPSREEFKNNLRKMSWAKLGVYYGVHLHKLHKWCELFNLPKKKEEINKFSLEEWKEL